MYLVMFHVHLKLKYLFEINEIYLYVYIRMYFDESNNRNRK